MTLICSCHRKTLVPICLRKKRPENSFLTLTMNYRHTCDRPTEKQFMPAKTTINWLFNDI